MAYTLEQMKEAITRLYQQGDKVKARKIAAMYQQKVQQNQQDREQMLPRTGNEDLVDAPRQEQERGIGETLTGVGEAALTAVTGATGGLVGGAAGAVEGAAREMAAGEFGTPAAAQRIAETSAERASQLTYMPRTAAGVEAVQGLASAAEPLAALPVIAPEAAAIGQAARGAATAARATATPDLRSAARQGIEMMRRKEDTPIAGRSVGAAESTQEAVNRAAASEIGVKLTKGEATRDPEQLRFEKTEAKFENGAPLRQNMEANNRQLMSYLDGMIEETGSRYSEDLPQLGKAVIEPIKADMKLADTKINYKYGLARAKGALMEKADMAPLAQFLNENRARRVQDGLMTKVQRQLDAMEASQGDFSDGSLQIKPLTVNQAEEIYQFINAETNQADGTMRRLSKQLREAVDRSTDAAAEGNKYYREARDARIEKANKFESVQLVSDLVNTKKNTEDRIIALEDVLSKVVTGAAAKNEPLQFLKKTLYSAGPDGQQAWREIQGGTLAYIRDRALTTATNSAGDAIVSPAKLENTLAPLLKSGKLEILFGQKGVRRLETLRDVAKLVQTVPPGVVNNSETTTLMRYFLESAVTGGTTGVPLPVIQAGKALMKYAKDAKTKQRIADALKQPNKDL